MGLSRLVGMCGWLVVGGPNKIGFHIVQRLLDLLHLLDHGTAELSLLLELLLQGEDLVSLAFFLLTVKSVPKGMKRICFLSLAEEIRRSAVPGIENLLTHIFGVILHLYEGIFVNNIDNWLFAFIIIGKSLVNLVAENKIKGAVEFGKSIDRVDVLGDRCAATETVEAQVGNVTILNIPADIGSGSTLISAGRETFPALSVCRLAHLTVSSILHGMVREAINIIGGVSCLTLIPHRVGVTWVDVCAIIHIDVEVFVISVVTIVSHEWHDKVACSGSAGTAVS